MLQVSHADARMGTGRSAATSSGRATPRRPLADLLTFVSKNMPNGQGGTLPAATYNDLVALILKSNGFPPGPTELAPRPIAERRRSFRRTDPASCPPTRSFASSAAWLRRAGATGR